MRVILGCLPKRKTYSKILKTAIVVHSQYISTEIRGTRRRRNWDGEQLRLYYTNHESRLNFYRTRVRVFACSSRNAIIKRIERQIGRVESKFGCTTQSFDIKWLISRISTIAQYISHANPATQKMYVGLPNQVTSSITFAKKYVKNQSFITIVVKIVITLHIIILKTNVHLRVLLSDI